MRWLPCKLTSVRSARVCALTSTKHHHHERGGLSGRDLVTLLISAGQRVGITDQQHLNLQNDQHTLRKFAYKIKQYFANKVSFHEKAA